jgi:hypothetical protein
MGFFYLPTEWGFSIYQLNRVFLFTNGMGFFYLPTEWGFSIYQLMHKRIALKEY